MPVHKFAQALMCSIGEATAKSACLLAREDGAEPDWAAMQSLDERVLVFFVELVELLLDESNRVLLDEEVGVVKVVDDELVMLLVVKPDQELLHGNVARHQYAARRVHHG